MTAPIQGVIQREFQGYHNENGGQVRAHVVTEDTAGTVNEAYTGRSRDAVVGDVLIEGPRPDQYVFMDAREFNEVYAVDDDAPGQPDTDTTVFDEQRVTAQDEAGDGEKFDPSTKTASDVREYLNRMKRQGDTDEFNRVAEAERSGQNRSSAIPVI